MSRHRGDLPCRITTGVHNAGSILWMWDGDAIDLLRERHLAACAEEYLDGCGPEEADTTLYGNWDHRDTGYTPEHGGEYSAIFNPDQHTVQVVASRYATRCARCSPCYPNQGDVDKDGNIWAYCLPPELMDENWVKENGQRVYERGTGRNGRHDWRRWRR
ncbi:MAG: hypothetical protein A4E55_02392 [Pelotomaculum sp. PtaU1.Bin035]|nr:MAG: hypothetical protein A4E55_02392 [Pelotomaculum sp. PtaU1.Bin035]